MALWQLGLMYENGEGVQQDKVQAFGYFNKIADEHADAAPKGVDSDIVAQSFVKVGEYYRDGLPEAGLQHNEAIPSGACSMPRPISAMPMRNICWANSIPTTTRSVTFHRALAG